MVQKKINDFTLAGSVGSTMQLETDIGGSTANKVNISQLTSYFGDNITYFSPTNIIYVAKNGNDSTGNGTLAKPFLTIAAANAAISGASTSNRFLVFIYSGTYAETALKAKAYVYYLGQGPSTRVSSTTNNWELDLVTGGWGATARGAILNMQLTGSTGFSLDFTSLASSSAVLDFVNLTANGNFTLLGRPSGADTIQMFNSYCLGSVSISNFQGFIRNSFCNGSFAYVSSTVSVTLDVLGFSFPSLTVTSSGGFVATMNIFSSTISSTLTISDAASVVSLDAVSHPFAATSLVNGSNAVVNKRTASYAINYLHATAALNFGLIAANTSADLTIAVTGAVVGDVVALGSPVVVSGIAFSAFVSATDTVTVRAANITTGGISLSSGNFTVKII